MLSVIEYINELTYKYKYKKLPLEVSIEAHNLYLTNLPHWCKLDGDAVSLFSNKQINIASGYERIVIGDYGAFLEIDETQIFSHNLIIQPGQEYRVSDPKYKDNVKYNWLTTFMLDIKIYQQKKTVNYADYKPGKYYVSPYEIGE